jgi:hypothetical protein
MSGVFIRFTSSKAQNYYYTLVLNTCFKDRLQLNFLAIGYEKSPVNIECFWIFLLGGFLQSRETHELYTL